MAHVEGVLTLVTRSGPWFRLQGRHTRYEDKPIGLRLSLDPRSGVLVDVHLGEALWLRTGWYPAHAGCAPQAHGPTANAQAHRCFGRWLRPRVFSYGVTA